MPFRARNLLLASLLLLLYSCNGYQKVLKSTDVNYKLTKANEYYSKKDWSKANALYESLLPVMKNTRNYEPLYYRYSYTFYYMHEYLEASYNFKNFVDFFPSSKDAVECEYMYGMCLYKFSPQYTLDQTNTIKSMEVLQSFVNTHPNSKYLKDANTYIDECREKLEKKDASAAKLYYNIEQYKAAGVAYNSVMQHYPTSSNSDFYQYMIVKSDYYFAKESIKTKQEERFANTISAYHDLVDNYPHSQYLQDAEKFYTLANNAVNNIRNEHK